MPNTEKPRTSYKRGRGRAYLWILENAGHDGDECLWWPFNKDTKGYGQVGYCGKVLRAHRIMCQIAWGDPPTPKHQASHECGNGSRGCVNPKHLKWKTNSENQKDKRRHGTHYNGRTGRRSKLTARQQAEIQALKGIVPIMELAKRYGVKRGTIDRWHRIARDGYDKNSIRPKKSASVSSD